MSQLLISRLILTALAFGFLYLVWTKEPDILGWAEERFFPEGLFRKAPVYLRPEMVKFSAFSPDSRFAKLTTEQVIEIRNSSEETRYGVNVVFRPVAPEKTLKDLRAFPEPDQISFKRKLGGGVIDFQIIFIGGHDNDGVHWQQYTLSRMPAKSSYFLVLKKSNETGELVVTCEVTPGETEPSQGFTGRGVKL